MITIRIKGGLGNQLFQYAAGYALAHRLNQPLELDTSFFRTQILREYRLNAIAIEHNKIQRKKPLSIRVLNGRGLNKILRKLNIHVVPLGKQKNIYLLESHSDIVPEYFSIDNSNIYIDGYYQSEKYFGKYRHELIKQFTPNYKPQEQFLQVLRKLQSCNSVAVHIRRGDLLKLQNGRNPYLYLLGEGYYQNAILYMKEKINNPKFFWFSDDIEWARQKFGDREDSFFVKLNTEHRDIDELMLMKNCHHTILANSTFSWWAAWLNEYDDAIHTYPAKEYGKKYMIPSNWVKIEIDR